MKGQVDHLYIHPESVLTCLLIRSSIKKSDLLRKQDFSLQLGLLLQYVGICVEISFDCHLNKFLVTSYQIFLAVSKVEMYLDSEPYSVLYYKFEVLFIGAIERWNSSHKKSI